MVLLLVCPGLLWAGDLSATEDLVESDQERFDPLEVLERLEELRRFPLDPNRASFSQLEQIPYLSVHQIEGILKARQKERFLTLNDLLGAPGMDPGTLARVRSFLKIVVRRTGLRGLSSTQAMPGKGVRGHLRVRTAGVRPLSRGYREGQYLGDPSGGYLRLHLASGRHVWAGILAEKDPGEPELADYVSFSLRLDKLGPVRRLLLGDFALEFGQGLALWTCGGLSGGVRDISDLKRKARGIRPYTSAEENSALRGLALSLGLDRVTLHLFHSRSHLDASRENGAVTALVAGGLHRTAGELEKKDALREIVSGGHLDLRLADRAAVGLTWCRWRWRPLMDPPRSPGRRYALRGDEHRILGGDVDVAVGPLCLFAEAAVAEGSAAAFLAGLSMEQRTVRAGLLWRRYPPEFCNPRGSGKAAKDDQNETGVLMGLKWKVSPGTHVELLADGFRRPWRTFYLEMPATGGSWSLRAQRRFGAGITMAVRLKCQDDQVSTAGAHGLQKNLPSRRITRRFQVDWRVSDEIEIRSRLETSRASTAPQGSLRRGALLLGQVKISLGAGSEVKAAAALFHIPDYGGRIYLCEVGPRGTARNVALFGRGTRVFLLLSRLIREDLEASLRFCSTAYHDRRDIGTGRDRIDGDVKREFILQADWNW
jgi:hypothetical protein